LVFLAKIVNSSTPGEEFQRLVDLMARLRGPGGCPWDREQTFETIERYLLEEAYEVIDAIRRGDFGDLREELGDLLLQPVFFAQMASERGVFDVADSLRAINEKLIRRHPHVFGDAVAETPEAVKTTWDAIKKTEKAGRGVPDDGGILGGIAKALPALVEAKEISRRAAKAGFDWENVGQVVEKLHEELAELEEAVSEEERAGEIGDLLFVLVNVARFYGVDPEQALRNTNAKFQRRFAHMEKRLAEQGRGVEGTGIAELESLWQEAKQSG
jgi:MazG family protein